MYLGKLAKIDAYVCYSAHRHAFNNLCTSQDLNHPEEHREHDTVTDKETHNVIWQLGDDGVGGAQKWQGGLESCQS